NCPRRVLAMTLSIVCQRLLESLGKREAGIDVSKPEDRVSKDFFRQALSSGTAGQGISDGGMAMHDIGAAEQMMQQHFHRWPLALLRLAACRGHGRLELGFALVGVAIKRSICKRFEFFSIHR